MINERFDESNPLLKYLDLEYLHGILLRHLKVSCQL